LNKTIHSTPHVTNKKIEYGSPNSSTDATPEYTRSQSTDKSNSQNSPGAPRNNTPNSHKTSITHTSFSPHTFQKEELYTSITEEKEKDNTYATSRTKIMPNTWAKDCADTIQSSTTKASPNKPASSSYTTKKHTDRNTTQNTTTIHQNNVYF
jgi:hypothetical protein